MAKRRPKLLGSEQLLEYGLRLLHARSLSSGELRLRLRRKAEREEDVAPVLARLKEYGYLNDRAFAAGFAASRLENRGFGKARVLRDLRQRRVDPAIAAESVENVYKDTEEEALVAAFLARKFRKIELSSYLKDPMRLASAYRKLRLAGFSSGASIRVLQRYAAEAGELENMEDGETEAGLDL
ncbi:MAG: RecX family transcriptional regulator [Bryobacteraceae bacterium]|nr:RecX family transcriptional regulator [Bryobacterales bacterium]MEB2361283.1 regulatory protein RecX [Bryobacterales bacterium]NUN04055.1 RecX family transcriptional regulator [Bryobacteraceae bacterium]